ncbi:MAG: flavin reductase family protein [Rhodospirillaceae bacterium]|jgi:flavin reductase (DIM6/NTAB) family NADH-FMN oxidoreductase RutF|nr:flavin reductase family protein [Rhodospirillaceae bacterium]MBT5456782.1 flavin reductase family protein [Rhodospirillaceae bacterium]
MFFEPKNDDHGLPFNPFKACVVPRPIGWITSLSHDGIVNLAPFSISNQLSYDPPFVFFSGSGTSDEIDAEPRRKDSVVNAEDTGEFVYNMATYSLREQVNLSSKHVARDVDELEMCGLTPAPCNLIKCPRVAESPVSLECRHHATLSLPSNSTMGVHHVVIGEVVGIHINDDALTDGKVDWVKIQPLARMGYMDYTTVTEVFTMKGPKGEEIRPGQIGESSKSKLWDKVKDWDKYKEKT